MKKYLSIICLAAIFVTLVSAVPAMAATTASLSPVSVKAVAGRSFTLTVAVDPQGAGNYAEKLEIDFPAENLEVTSFVLSNNWIALPGSSYDVIDNTNGVLIKTAGYPGGILGAATFGTITFHTKKSGSGIIKIGNSSSAFEVNTQSAITGSGTAFVVSAAASASSKKVSVQVKPKALPMVQEATSTVATSTPEAVQPKINTQTASVAGAITPSYSWLWVIFMTSGQNTLCSAQG